MKSTVLSVYLSVAATLSHQVYAEDNTPKLLEYKNNNNGLGEYNFRYVLSDEQERDESGQFEGEDNYVVRGYYSYVDTRGDKVFVTYYADKTGYHPTVINLGDIPKPSVPFVPFGGVPSAVVASLLG